MPENLTLRAAQTSDVQALAAFAVETYTAAFGHSFAPEDLAAHLRANLSEDTFVDAFATDSILLAFSGNRLAGFIQFGVLVNSSAEQEVRRLYVHADFQNQRVGTALLEAALRMPRMAQADAIVLDVWEHNLGGIRFYKRHGFEVTGMRRFDVPSGAETSADLIMTRRAHYPSTG